MAKAVRTFKMNENIYNSMMDIARELGKKRIQPKDFQKYGIEEITGTVQPDDVKSDDNNKKTVVSAEVSKKSDEDKKSEEKTEKKAPAKKDVDKSGKTLEKKEKVDKPSVTLDELVKQSLADFSKNLRKISTEDIIQFAKDNGVDTVEDASDERIRRMRVVMNLKAKFYPGQSLEPKKVSFKGIELQKLLDFADEQGIEYRHASEEKIQKMWVIYALNQAGFYDLPDESVDDSDDEKGTDDED